MSITLSLCMNSMDTLNGGRERMKEEEDEEEAADDADEPRT